MNWQRKSSSDRAQNEWQGALNTIQSRRHCRNSGTWTEGSDRPSGEEIALSLIGWLGAAGAQISRFQEENSLVKWIGTERALCALCVSSDSCVFCPFLCLNVCRGESVCFYGCVQTQRRAQESGRLVWEKENSQVVSEEEKGGNSCGSTKIDWWMGGKK